MKRLIALTLAMVGIAGPARAQWVVYDPANTVQSVLNTAQEIAKFIEMINNQVQQIETLTDQLNEFKHYESLFGDPKTVVLSMVPALTADLRKTEEGKNLESLLGMADGAYALAYDGLGIYNSIGQTFATPGGQTVGRPADKYRSYAAISRTADNYIAVAADVAARRAAIKVQIAQTIEQLKNSPTDAETQKLQGILTSLNSDLESTDAEVNQALASAVVQDIQNRNDQKKQAQALTEQQNAEFEEAVRNFNQKFQLSAEPTLFPTQ
jgi:hypothetical protein